MNNKLNERLLDGMPPHIAEKVDKMIGNMKEVYDLAMESWEGCDGCTEDDKHFFINGFMRGYNMGKPNKINLEEIEEEAKFRSQIESVQYADGFIEGIEWYIDKLKEKQ